VAASSDTNLHIFDLNHNCVSMVIPAHDDDINTVTYADSLSANVICSGSDDRLIKVWDRRSLGASHAPAGCLTGHTEGLTCVKSKGDCRYLVSNGKDQTLRVWDMRKMASSVPNDHHYTSWDYRSAYLPPSAGGRHGRTEDLSLQTFRGHTVLQTLIRCDFSPQHTTGGRYVMTGSYEGLVFFYDLVSGERFSTRMSHESLVRQAAWHPYQPLLISSSWDGYLAEHQCNPAKFCAPPEEPDRQSAGSSGDSDGDDGWFETRRRFTAVREMPSVRQASVMYAP